MDVTLKISFTPTKVSPDIRYNKLACQVEGVSAPLLITLIGSCVPQSDNETLTFKTPVRKRQAKNITLTNQTSDTWKLKPVIVNDYWSGSKALFKLAPGQSSVYEIAYLPLTMTSDKTDHRGSIFFALPDGSGITYQLIGYSLAPAPSGIITKNIPCKQQHSHLLPINNWLNQPQRFKVTIESETLDASTTVKGVDYIDVPALGQRQYKLNFYSYKENTFNVKVVFTNEETKEYLFYLLTFTTTPPEILETIDLETPIRKPISHTFTLENPLSVPATFSMTCDSEDVSFAPFTLAPG